MAENSKINISDKQIEEKFNFRKIVFPKRKSTD